MEFGFAAHFFPKFVIDFVVWSGYYKNGFRVYVIMLKHLLKTSCLFVANDANTWF
jgi:hypothetical protein